MIEINDENQMEEANEEHEEGFDKQGSSNSSDGVKDRHPEKRMKAAYQKFEDERMAELKIEYPTLKMSQLKEKIWKEVRNIRQYQFNLN